MGFADLRIYRTDNIVQSAVSGMSQWIAFIYSPYRDAEDKSL